MQKICVVVWLGLLAACTGQHGPRANCDGKLRPINTSESLVAIPLANVSSVKTADGGQ
jgi:hypothetical protein